MAVTGQDGRGAADDGATERGFGLGLPAANLDLPASLVLVRRPLDKAAAWMAPLPYPPTLAPLPPARKPKTRPPPPAEADHQAPGPVRLAHGSVGAVTFDNPRDVDRELAYGERRRLELRAMGRRGTDGEHPAYWIGRRKASLTAKARPPSQPSSSTRSLRLSSCSPRRDDDHTPQATKHPSTSPRPACVEFLQTAARQLTSADRPVQKRFLTTLPEVAHVPYELLHDPIVAAHKAAQEQATVGPAWDPYEGNRIATTSAQNIFFPNQAAVGLVAFPTGQLGEELSTSTGASRPSTGRTTDRLVLPDISTLTVKLSRRIPPKERFTPAVRPVATFLTPIRQIVSSPYQTISHGRSRSESVLSHRLA